MKVDSLSEKEEVLVLTKGIIDAGRIPTSKQEFEVFSSLYYIMSYKEFLSQVLFHRLKEDAIQEIKVKKGCGKKVEDGFYCGEYKYLCSECVKKGKNEK